MTVMISASSRSAALSDRECEILEHLANGQSIEEIASTLFLSPHTVRTHIKNILRKTGTRNRAHAVALALWERRIDFQPAASYR